MYKKRRSNKNTTKKNTSKRHKTPPKKGGRIVPKLNLDDEGILTKFDNKEIIKQRIVGHIDYCERTFQQLESYRIDLINERIETSEEYMFTREPGYANDSKILGQKIDLVEYTQEIILDYFQEFRNLYSIFLDYDDMNEETRENYLNIYRKIVSEMNEILENYFGFISS
jgi:hypothetical protein